MRVLNARPVDGAPALLGEGPLWDDGRRELVWLDTPAGEIHRLDPSTGSQITIAVAPPVSTAVLREDGRILLTHGRRIAALDEETATATDLDDHCGLSFILNDGSVDARGRLWTGTARRRKLPTP